MSPDGSPHLVPIVHAVVDDVIVFAVDHKPKSGRPLRRIRNIETESRVAVLFERRSDDWDELWWVRAEGIATVHPDPPSEAGSLQRRYPQYRSTPPSGPWIRISVTRWSGWSAT